MPRILMVKRTSSQRVPLLPAMAALVLVGCSSPQYGNAPVPDRPVYGNAPGPYGRDGSYPYYDRGFRSAPPPPPSYGQAPPPPPYYGPGTPPSRSDYYGTAPPPRPYGAPYGSGAGYGDGQEAAPLPPPAYPPPPDRPFPSGRPYDRQGLGGSGVLPANPAAPREAPKVAAYAAPTALVTIEVQQGDTLYRIARSQGVPVAALMAANSMNSTQLTPGQKLIIPPASSPATDVRPASERR